MKRKNTIAEKRWALPFPKSLLYVPMPISASAAMMVRIPLARLASFSKTAFPMPNTKNNSPVMILAYLNMSAESWTSDTPRSETVFSPSTQPASPQTAMIQATENTNAPRSAAIPNPAGPIFPEVMGHVITSHLIYSFSITESQDSVTMKNVFFVGTAGSGKSTLVGAYKQWLDDSGVDAIIVNMDPGADALPYEPDIDIREWISLDEVMQEYSLGPNGAQVVAADLMAVNIRKMMEVLSTYKSDYVLVDTPGQLELFAFRESSNITVRAFGQQDSILVYLSDPSLCRTPNGFISAMTLGALAQFRLQLPMINILSKCDTLSEEDEQRMLDWYSCSDALYGDLLDSDSNPETVVGMELFKAMENTGVFGEIRAVSAQDFIGLEEIYAASQLAFFGGEDNERE